jgi:hypothetical protein
MNLACNRLTTEQSQASLHGLTAMVCQKLMYFYDIGALFSGELGCLAPTKLIFAGLFLS